MRRLGQLVAVAGLIIIMAGQICNRRQHALNTGITAVANNNIFLIVLIEVFFVEYGIDLTGVFFKNITDNYHLSYQILWSKLGDLNKKDTKLAFRSL